MTDQRIRWNRTDKHGGDECLGTATSKCGQWRLERRLYCAGGGRDRYHWFAYRRVGVSVRMWELVWTIRTITEAKRIIQQENGLIEARDWNTGGHDHA